MVKGAGVAILADGNTGAIELRHLAIFCLAASGFKDAFYIEASLDLIEKRLSQAVVGE